MRKPKSTPKYTSSGDSTIEILVEDDSTVSHATSNVETKRKRRRPRRTSKAQNKPTKMSFKETNSRRTKSSKAQNSTPSTVESELSNNKRRSKARLRDSKRKANEKPLSEEAQKSIESKLAKVEDNVKKSLSANFGVDDINTLPAITGDILPVNSEAMFLSSYMKIYDDVSSLVDVAKGEYLKSKQSRDVYALMSLYSQLRETIADLRGISDVSQQSAIINSEVLEPLMQSVAQVIVDMYFQISTMFRQVMPEDKVEESLSTLKMITATHGKRVDDNFKSARDKLYTTMATK